MKHEEFKIGEGFAIDGRAFVCTDIGTRTIVAIPTRAKVGGAGESNELSEAETLKDGWLNGPPYAVQEIVIDENDMPACEPAAALVSA